MMFPLLISLASCQQTMFQANTFAIDQQNDVLAKSLVKTPVHGQNLDDLVGQLAGCPFIYRIVGPDHVLFVQDQLQRPLASGCDKKNINTHQDPDNGVVVWISHIVGEILDDIKKKTNKVVVHEHYPSIHLSVTHIIWLPHRPKTYPNPRSSPVGSSTSHITNPSKVGGVPLHRLPPHSASPESTQGVGQTRPPHSTSAEPPHSAVRRREETTQSHAESPDHLPRLTTAISTSSAAQILACRTCKRP